MVGVKNNIFSFRPNHKVLHATSLIRCMQPKLPASDNGAEPELFTIHMASKVQATGEAQGGATVYEDLFNP